MMMKESNLFSVSSSVMIIGAMGLSLLITPYSSADVCTDPQTAVEYDSSDGDDVVGTTDLDAVLYSWGQCP